MMHHIKVKTQTIWLQNFSTFSFQLYWAKLTHDEDAPSRDQIILDTQWFNAEILGRAFAGEDFSNQFTTLPESLSYTYDELDKIFSKKMETKKVIELLNHMDLLHETENSTFLLPGKLPANAPAVEWAKSATDTSADVKGRSIECKETIDIFSPTVFPCVQKKLLDRYKSTAFASRRTVKFLMGEVDVLVHLTKSKKKIYIAAKSPESNRHECYKLIDDTAEIVLSEVISRSQGTDIYEAHISQRALKEKQTLEEVWTFTKEELESAERNTGGVITRKGSMTREYVSHILYQGMS